MALPMSFRVSEGILLGFRIRVIPHIGVLPIVLGSNREYIFGFRIRVI